MRYRIRRQSEFILLLTLLFPTAYVAGGQQAASNDLVMMHYRKAASALANGQPEHAADEFAAILKIDPNNAQAYANLGVIAYRKADFRSATDYFENALKRDSGLWDAKAFLGLCNLKAGDANVGVPLLQESFAHVRNVGVKIDAGVALIRYHEQNKTLNETLNVLHQLEQAVPQNPEVLYVAYRVYSELAEQRLSALATAAPNSARLYQVYGEASMTQDDFAGAIAQFRKAINIDPKLPGAHYQLGMALITNAQDASARQEAQHAFEAELELDPADFRSEYELGQVLRLSKQSQEAKRHFARALQLNPNYAEAHMEMGTILIDEGKREEGAAQLAVAIHLDPDNEAAHYRLARLYRQMGRTAEAEKEMAAFQTLHQAHQSRSTQPSGKAPADATDP